MRSCWPSWRRSTRETPVVAIICFCISIATFGLGIWLLFGNTVVAHSGK